MPEPPPFAPDEFPDSLAKGASALLKARIMIAKAELPEAGKVVGIRVGMAIGAALLAFFGYAALAAAMIGGLAALADWSWPVAALTIALLHFIIAGILGWMLSKRWPEMFPITRSEFEKDKEWLKTHKNESES